MDRKKIAIITVLILVVVLTGVRVFCRDMFSYTWTKSLRYSFFYLKHGERNIKKGDYVLFVRHHKLILDVQVF